MRIECECGKFLKVDDSLVGKRVKCPGCGETMLVRGERAAIASGKPRPAVMPDENTPPPRKRRNTDEDEGIQAPPRKRRAVADEEEAVPRKRPAVRDVDDDEDEEESRPKKKKKKQQKGLPVGLLIGGAAALLVLFFVLVGGGIGAYFLFIRKSDGDPKTPTTGPGSKSDPVAVMFKVPAKVGESYDLDVAFDGSMKIQGQAPFQGFQAKDDSVRGKFQGQIKVVNVDNKGRESRAEMTVSSFTFNKGKGDQSPLQANMTIIRDGSGFGTTYTRKDGAALPFDALDGLQLFFGRNIIEESEDDELFGTREKKAVGDTWPVNKALIAKEFNKGAAGGGLSVQEANCSGTGKFTGVSEQGGVKCLDFEIQVNINQNGPQAMANGVQANVGIAMTITASYRMPADYSTGPLKQSMKLDMKCDIAAQGPGGVANATVALFYNKVETRKYLTTGKGPAEGGKGPRDGKKGAALKLRPPQGPLLETAQIDWREHPVVEAPAIEARRAVPA
jgi:hypothetical protein